MNNSYRPHFHFAPASGWMNDPNGLVFFECEWHLFFQHRPAGQSEMHWGHAVSRDLVGWETLPIALAPDTLGAIWSGSCVVDEANTSDFFEEKGGLVAIFTHQTAQRQAQSLAFSSDRGRTWTKYAGNPVLTSKNPDFRDPKVFWHAATSCWIMVVAAGERAQVYRSNDLKNWQFCSDFGARLAPNMIWECPDLFSLRDETGREIWMLSCSLMTKDAVAGQKWECFAAYFSGTFDGEVFISNDVSPQRLSLGPDDYAPVSFAGAPDNRVITLGWMNDWGYAAHIPTVGWQGTMTLPRELGWRNGRLVQNPVGELQFYRGAAVKFEPQEVRPEAPFAFPTQRGACEIIVELEPGDAREIGIRLLKNGEEQTTIGCDITAGRVFFDRSRSGLSEFHPPFACRHEAPLPLDARPIRLHIFADSCSVEVFFGEGEVYFAGQVFPTQTGSKSEIYCVGGTATVSGLEIRRLTEARKVLVTGQGEL